MGLDMYLYAERYVSGYEWQDRDEKDTYRAIVDALGVEPTPSTPGIGVNFTAVYWRKANAIHNWFVNECQDGIDDCREVYVSRDSLKKLVDLCQEVIDTGDTSLLPSIQGFFFGSTEYDEWYFDDLKRTIEDVNSALERFDDRYSFSYQSSW